MKIWPEIKMLFNLKCHFMNMWFEHKFGWNLDPKSKLNESFTQNLDSMKIHLKSKLDEKWPKLMFYALHQNFMKNLPRIKIKILLEIKILWKLDSKLKFDLKLTFYENLTQKSKFYDNSTRNQNFIKLWPEIKNGMIIWPETRGNLGVASVIYSECEGGTIWHRHISIKWLNVL